MSARTAALLALVVAGLTWALAWSVRPTPRVVDRSLAADTTIRRLTREAAQARAAARAHADTAQMWADSAARYRRRAGRVAVHDTLVLEGLPPVRGGWQGVTIADGPDAAPDTLPTPRLLVQQLVLRDSVIALGDRALAHARQAFGAEAVAHDATRHALRVSEADRRALRDAVRRLERRPPWYVWLAAGAVVGVTLAR